MTTAAEILTKARTLIETKGHTKRTYAKSKGVAVDAFSPDADCYCALGALRVAGEHDEATGFYQASHALRAAATILVPCEVGAVERYNDDPSTTKENVLDLFTHAIRIANATVESA